MKIITRKYNVYKFDELSDDIQKKVVDENYDINTSHEWWWDTYEDAKLIGLIITGFDLYTDIQVKASFSDDALTVAQAIVKNHGKNCLTYKSAKWFLKYYDKLNDDQKKEFCNTDDLAQELLADLSVNYMQLLKEEFDYLTSKTQIIESIIINDYDFLDNGKFFSC